MKKLLGLLLSLSIVVSVAAGCTAKAPTETPTETPGGTTTGTTTPLVVGYAAFSQKFSPFFATTAYDQDAQALTQLALLTTDRTGGIIYNAIKGETVAYEGKDYLYTGPADVSVKYDEAADVTTYNLKIRDDIKFSDGKPMTADDIIFTYYVLADPSYTGSSTLYSYDIIGMTNYRENNSMAEELAVTAEELAAALENPSDEAKAAMAALVKDTLTSELDWVKGLYGTADFKDQQAKYPVAKDLFAFFYGIDEKYDSAAVADEAQVLADVIAQYGTNWKTLGANYGGSEDYFKPDLETSVTAMVLKEKLSKANGKEVPNIEGIKKLSATEVEVKLNGFEAPAVYSIAGIQVAPLHYYGDATLYDYENNKFGFTRGDLAIVEAKTDKPMGAGPYKFVKYEDKIVYYEANENYYKGAPVTKYLQLKETVDAEMIAGVGTGVIDIANPSGSKPKFEELKTYNSNKEVVGDKITSVSVDNLGYGYIGINSKNVNVGGQAGSDASKNLRKGYATVLAAYRDVAIDSYYGDAADVINYPISNTSWAAPQKSDPDYAVAFSKGVDGKDLYKSDMVAEDKYAAAMKAAIEYFKAAGYTFDEASGKFTAAPAGANLEYEIIIPGDGNGDHPAFAILADASAALAKIGIGLKINDVSDANMLWDAIDANTHQMWTAAWGATIDPDMYQVYHSSNGIGLGGTDSNNYNIADDTLDELIIAARTSDDQAFRKSTYKSALDVVIDWAVEIPTYQRQNLVIFSTERVKLDTVTPDITTYWTWMNDLEKITMNK